MHSGGVQPRRLVGVWLGAVGVLATLVAVSQFTSTGGDDPDPGRQRPGILDLGALPIAAPPLPGVEYRGSETVVFFAGRHLDGLCLALRRLPGGLTRTEVVVVSAGPVNCAEGVTVVDMSPREAARAFGLSRTRDGGPPVGYALIDDRGQIRYRTLDPTVPPLFDEVATMLRAMK